MYLTSSYQKAIRFVRALLILSFLISGFNLSGCTQFLSATHKSPVHQDPGQRSRGEKIDDVQIKRHLKVNIDKADPKLKKANINVASYNGIVLLTGEVPNQQLREVAGAIARDMTAVRQVNNEIQIASKSTIFSRTNDNWIATKITGKIVKKKLIEINRVKIIVENRIVYIMGLLTEKEAAAIAEVASTTKGVRRVVRAVELVPEHERAPI